MPFLLLLSALLTALTGVVSGARPVEISAQCPLTAAQSQRFVAAIVPLLAGHAHLLGAFGVTSAFATADPMPAMSAAAPRLYLDRPRA